MAHLLLADCHSHSSASSLPPLAMLSITSLQFLFLAFLTFQIRQHGVDVGSLHSVLFGVSVLIIVTLIVVVFALLAKYIVSERSRTVYWTNRDEEVRIRKPKAGKYHAFISHRWKTGQDQVAVIKRQLCSMLAGVSIFLECVSCSRSTDL